MDTRGYQYDNLDYQVQEEQINAAWLIGPIGPFCEDFERHGYCGHGTDAGEPNSTCALIEETAEYLHYKKDEHDCPYQEFLDDPITEYYGVGYEMLGLISCPVCDKEN